MLQEPTHRQEDVPEENARGFFHVPQCRLTASGRHAQSSSFIYSAYYPPPSPATPTAAQGDGKREKTRDGKREEETVTMSDIQCQAKT